jgi:hypothetical protein
MRVVIAQTIGLTLASALAGILLCAALWLIFRLVRHPEWGPPLIVVPVALAMAGALPDSEFLHRTLIFAAAAVGPFYIAGLIWRVNRRTAAHRDDAPVAPSPRVVVAPDQPYYPAIAACIREDRRPSPGELKKVTRRIWREVYADRDPAAGFAARRSALRAARASLEGS